MLTISICTNIEKYAIGKHCNDMEKYANTICVLVKHVSYTELCRIIFQYSSIPELRQLSSRYSLYKALVEIRQPIQFTYFPYLYSSELRQLTSCYYLYKTLLEIRQHIQFEYFSISVHFRIMPSEIALFSEWTET